MPPTRREKEYKRLNNTPWGDLQKLAKENGVKARKKDDIIEEILKIMKLPPASGNARLSTRTEDAPANESDEAAEVAVELTHATTKGKGKRPREDDHAETAGEPQLRVPKRRKGKGKETSVAKEEEIDQPAEDEQFVAPPRRQPSSRKGPAVSTKGRGKDWKSKHQHQSASLDQAPTEADTESIQLDEEQQKLSSRVVSKRRSAAPEPASTEPQPPEPIIPPVPTLPSEPTLETVITAFRQTLSVLNTMRSALTFYAKLRNDVDELTATALEFQTDMDQTKKQLPELDERLGEVKKSLEGLGGSTGEGTDAPVKLKDLRHLETRFEENNARLESWEGQVNRLIDADLLDKLENLGHQVETGSAGGNGPSAEDWRKKVESLEQRVLELEKTPIIPAPWTGNLLAQGRLKDALPLTPEPEKDRIEEVGEGEDAGEDVDLDAEKGREEKEIDEPKEKSSKPVERIHKEYTAPEVHRKVISTQSNVITVSTTTVMGGKFHHSYL
ncbi:uncharacterized protein EI90DRAFT_3032889 [Cantharellus anzutake]|uniref:uncharacterized protein n=1 Tax=Cantharellus anzutake TaxID=1750568 RepID=UPI00190808FA|nr:uncharacterized protein EI90DRAFT_3032889 [Cantharellus anzutake]KAF8342317.1 hypothetical protein EI90DRAFT_3032889 [Cantharellus anzutake]